MAAGGRTSDRPPMLDLLVGLPPEYTFELSYRWYLSVGSMVGISRHLGG